MDDGWICDEDFGNNDDGVDEFINESESQTQINASAMRDSINGSTGQAAIDEDQRIRRLEKKEIERIARRFKVITPAEFEHNLSMANESQIDKKSNRPDDSWMPNQLASINNITNGTAASTMPDTTHD